MREPTIIRPAGHYRTLYEMEVDPGATIDDVLGASFANIARHLRPGDRISVWPQDRAWEADLVVRSVGKLTATVALFHYVLFDGVEAQKGAEYQVKWISPGAKYGVIRLSDGATISSGHDTRDVAETWVKSHMKAMAA